MARRSNKTAHVLNLLAGHEASKEAEEQASAAENASADAASQAAQKAPEGSAAQASGGGTSGQPVSGGTASGNGTQTAAAPTVPPAPAPAASGPNNIAMIDKTGEDPVAELIQQKLSSEFEKQMQQSSPDILAPDDAEPLADAISPDAPMEMEDPAPAADADDIPAADMDLDILLASDAEEIETLVDEAPGEPVPTQDSVAPPQTAAAPVQEAPPEPVPAQEITPAPQTAAAPVQEAAPKPAPAQESAPAPQTAASPIQEAAPDPAPAQESAPAPQMTAAPKSEAPSSPMQEAEPTSEIPAASAPVPEPEPEEDFAAVNVMEHIVNDKIIYFMRQFDVCTCSRCKADVTALTLNGLAPKYIVTMKAAVDPLLSYHTNRLISDVTVEATKACMIVKDNPRH